MQAWQMVRAMRAMRCGQHFAEFGSHSPRATSLRRQTEEDFSRGQGWIFNFFPSFLLIF